MPPAGAGSACAEGDIPRMWNGSKLPSPFRLCTADCVEQLFGVLVGWRQSPCTPDKFNPSCSAHNHLVGQCVSAKPEALLPRRRELCNLLAKVTKLDSLCKLTESRFVVSSGSSTDRPSGQGTC